ncbi:MAG: hypothetical protein JKY24_03760, partial [Pseudomonadales bacterium]|nr:hypothetical protein [Pseudomonadales bacterium]
MIAPFLPCVVSINLFIEPIDLTHQSTFNTRNNYAIKFTNQGEIVVRAWTAWVNEREMLFFSIKDTGLGIDESTQEKLFHAFTQANSSVSRKYGGTGLGL